MVIRLALAILLGVFTTAPAPASAQAPAEAGDAPALSAFTTHVGNLGSLDYDTRMNAARMVRRAAAAEAVPALTDAVRTHRDEFVRYRALVLLTSFQDRGTGALMRELLPDRNDRVREIAYKWFELHPDRVMTPTLLASLQTETAEFVRPALVAALAALGQDPVVQRALLLEVGRGTDFFRSAVIEALGRHRAAYAVDAIAAVARLDGPLQDDAVLALARIGDARALPIVDELMDARPAGSAVRPTPVMPALTAADCLVAGRCDTHLAELMSAATAPGASRSLVRAAVTALTTVAAADDLRAVSLIYNIAAHGGLLREEAAIGLGAVAVRRPDQMLEWFERVPDEVRPAAVDLLKDGFDSLEEDFGEEQFFAAVRAACWKADDDSPGRALMATIMERLEF